MKNKGLIFKEVYFKNFLGYGNRMSHVKLDRPGITRIDGINNDKVTQGNGSNGVGKSAIIKAIFYGLFGETVGKMTVTNVVNFFNKKDCVVGVVFISDGDEYEVVRYRNMSLNPQAGIVEKNFITLYKNGNKSTNLASGTSNDVNKLMADHIIKMSSDVFGSVVSYNADDTAILNKTASEQRVIFEEGFQFGELSIRADNIKKQNSSLKKKILTLEATLNVRKEQYDKYQQQLSRLEQQVKDWDSEQHRKLSNLSNELDTLLSIDIDGERKLIEEYNSIQPKVEQLRDKKSVFVRDKDQLTTLVTGLTRERQGYTNTINAINSDINKLEREIDGYKSQLKTLAENKCPKCKQDLHDVDQIKLELDQGIEKCVAEIEQKRGDITQPESMISEMTGKITKVQSEISSTETQISDIDSEILQVLNSAIKPSKTSEYLDEVAGKIQRIKNSVDHIRKESNPHIQTFEDFKQDAPEIVDFTELNELENTLKHNTFLINLLTDKKSYIRKALINAKLPMINERLAHYLTKYHSDHRVTFKSDLTVDITARGRPFPYHNLSSGQKARIDISLALALRDVVIKSNRFVNICLFDELFDNSFDDMGLQSAIEIVKDKCRDEGLSVYVITHKSEVASLFHSNICVEFTNGFSHIPPH